MASDLIEGMAQAIRAALHDPDDVCISVAEAMADHGHQARAAWAYALSRLREPSEAALEGAQDEFAFATWDEVRRGFGLLLDAFAREHGLGAPREDRAGDATAEERVAAVAYQVVALLLARAGYFGHPEADRVLDWLSDPAEREKDLLPWPEPPDLGPPPDFAAERVARLERELGELRRKCEGGPEMPLGAPPGPQGGRFGDGTDLEAPEAGNAPNGPGDPLPAFRTSGGHAG